MASEAFVTRQSSCPVQSNQDLDFSSKRLPALREVLGKKPPQVPEQLVERLAGKLHTMKLGILAPVHFHEEDAALPGKTGQRYSQ